MSKKRDHLEVIHDILEVLRDRRGKVKPTHILYKSNLSSQMLKEYLTELLEKEFLTENKEKKGRTTYSLTEKGFNFLKDYKVIKSFTESYGLN